MRKSLLWSATVAISVLAACATTPRPGQPGYAYNVNGGYEAVFVASNGAFSGRIDLETSREGAVTGNFVIVSPISIDGDIVGTIERDSLDWAGTYENTAEGCGGFISGSGAITADGQALDGTWSADGCGGNNPPSGTYTFSRETD